MSTDLVREHFETATDAKYWAEPEHLVMNGARCLLGYKPEVDRSTRFHLTLEQKVEKVFNVLGIEPFSAESVEKYKQKMIRWPNRKAKLLEFLASPQFAKKVISIGTIGVCVLALQVMAVVIFVVVRDIGIFKWYHPISVMHWWSLAVPATPVVLMFAMAAYFGNNHVWARTFSWKMEPLSSHAKQVPLFALSRATEIIELLPEAKFSVESLTWKDEVLDPFLVMEVAGKKFYLDVWEEPKFEARRVK
jgi:hypothetical protein